LEWVSCADEVMNDIWESATDLCILPEITITFNGILEVEDPAALVQNEFVKSKGSL